MSVATKPQKLIGCSGELTKVLVGGIICMMINSNGMITRLLLTRKSTVSPSVRRLKVFDDPMAFEKIDEREDYGEERINLIGMCNGIILHVTYTERGERIRLISARKAKRYERDDYYRKNAT